MEFGRMAKYLKSMVMLKIVGLIKNDYLYSLK